MFQLIAKLFQEKCINHIEKNSILECNCRIDEKASKLFDIIWKTDVKWIQIFILEVTKLLPHIIKSSTRNKSDGNVSFNKILFKIFKF